MFVWFYSTQTSTAPSTQCTSRTTYPHKSRPPPVWLAQVLNPGHPCSFLHSSSPWSGKPRFLRAIALKNFRSRPIISGAPLATHDTPPPPSRRTGQDGTNELPFGAGIRVTAEFAVQRPTTIRANIHAGFPHIPAPPRTFSKTGREISSPATGTNPNNTLCFQWFCPPATRVKSPWHNALA